MALHARIEIEHAWNKLENKALLERDRSVVACCFHEIAGIPLCDSISKLRHHIHLAVTSCERKCTHVHLGNKIEVSVQINEV